MRTRSSFPAPPDVVEGGAFQVAPIDDADFQIRLQTDCLVHSLCELVVGFRFAGMCRLAVGNELVFVGAGVVVGCWKTWC